VRGAPVSDVFKPRSVACPRCECAMGEVVTIAPLQDQPGLIAYECPACLYVMSEIVPAQPSSKQASPSGR
jgi:hypothetical protein